MAVAVTISKAWFDRRVQHVIGTLTFSGNYATGGDTINLALPAIKSAKLPLLVQIQGNAGYSYRYVQGNSLATGKVLVMYYDYDKTSDGPAIELPAGAYPSGVTGDVVKFYAIFTKLR